MTDEAHELPSLEDLYPYVVMVKHKDRPNEVGLAVVKALEFHDIMNNTNFILELQAEHDRIALRFRKKKHAKWLKARKKDIRNAAL